MRDLNILNLTHTDLDGAVSGIVIKTVYPKARVNRVNYAGTSYYDSALQIIRTAKFDGIIFTDFYPDEQLIQMVHSTGKPYLVIDHHPRTDIREDMSGAYVIETGKCGAMVALEYFSKFVNLEHLRTLCEVTQDHDLWLRKMVPLSDNLNTLMYSYGFNKFMKRFMCGMDGYNLPDDARELLASHDREVDRYISNCVQHPLPHDGYYIEASRYMSDITLRLVEHYNWLVICGTSECTPGMTKLEFRTSLDGIDLGKTLREMGRGGGGHPGAAGQIIPTAEKDEFLETLGNILFDGAPAN